MARKEQDTRHMESYRTRSDMCSICRKQRVRREAGNRRANKDLEPCCIAARASTGDIS